MLSLKKMAFETIKRNVSSYGELLSQKLSPPWRQKLLDLLLERDLAKARKGKEMEYFNPSLCWPTFLHLLSVKTERINFEDLISMHREYINKALGNKVDFPLDEALKIAVGKAPNLKRLRICNPWLYTRGAEVEYCCSQEEIASIRKLTSLEYLSFVKNVYLPRNALVEILHDCKHLREIFFGIHMIDVKRDLRPSKRIKLDDKPLPDDFLCEMYSIPKRVSEFRFVEMTPHLVDLIFECKELVDEENLEEFPYLPSLKTVLFSCSQHSSHALRSFLKRNGQFLTGLRIHGKKTETTLTVKEIFELCKNLVSLSICGMLMPPHHGAPSRSFTWSAKKRKGKINKKRRTNNAS